MGRNKKGALSRRLACFLLMILLLEQVFRSEAYAGGIDLLRIAAGAAIALTEEKKPVLHEKENRMTPDELKEKLFSRSMAAGQTVSEPVAWESVAIASAEDLREFSLSCENNRYSANKYVYLEQDIDLSGTDYNPIPIFSGVFDGQGHTVTGLTYVGDGDTFGLIRILSETGSIRDLTVEGKIAAIDDKKCTGGICGINNGIIENSTFRGSLSGRSETGGIAGVNGVTGLILNCRNEAGLTGYYYTGGIAGKNYGIISDCRNLGNINDSRVWVEETDEMSTGKEFLSSFLDNDSNAETHIRAGIDTGGIAGLSKGYLARCENTAGIGHEHIGYNVGGIAGRQSGMVSFCVNEGKILGRKDVGGIVGQTEPYLTPEDVESLTEAVDKLHALIGTAVENMDGSIDVIKGDMDRLTAQADDATDLGNNLATILTDFANDTTGKANILLDRVSYVTHRMSDVTEALMKAGDHAEDMTEDLERLQKDVKKAKPSASENEAVEKRAKRIAQDTLKLLDIVSDIGEATGELEETVEEIQKLEKQMRKELPDLLNDLVNGDAAAKQTAVERLKDITGLLRPNINKLLEEVSDLEDVDDIGKEMLGDIDYIEKLSEKHLQQAEAAVSSNISKTTKHMGDAVDDLQEAGRSMDGIVGYLNDQPEIRLSGLGYDYDNAKNGLYLELKAINQTLSALTGHGAASSHQTMSDLSAVNDQINVILHIISDELDDLANNDNVDDLLFTDVSDEEIEQALAGRLDGCTNKGWIEGDVNIGGIAGTMAIDTEDPEDNAAGSVEIGHRNRYLLKNIISGCENKGFVTGKKNGIGGIAGYMAQGIVTGCGDYGYVESTDGRYVGGIAGQSLSIVRASYMCGSVGGDGYVGGIVGQGTTVTGCYGMPYFSKTGVKCGSVAGAVAMDDETWEQNLESVSDNYFVENGIGGIDRISYHDTAEGVSYLTMLTVSSLPSEFKHLKVAFRVEDELIAEQELSYGESLQDILYPDIIPPEGKWLKWEDTGEETMKGSRIITGEYQDMIRTLKAPASAETEEKSPAFLDGSFTDRVSLNAAMVKDGRRDSLLRQTEKKEEQTMLYEISVTGGDPGAGSRLRLYSPFKEASVYRYDAASDTWSEAEAEQKGSYMQVLLEGNEGVYGVVSSERSRGFYLQILIGAAGILLLFFGIRAFGRGRAGRRKKRSGRA